MLDFFRTSCITFAEKKGDEASQQLDHETKVKASQFSAPDFHSFLTKSTQ